MPRAIELSTAYARLILQSGVGTAEQLLAGVPMSVAELGDSEFLGLAELGPIFRNYNRLVNNPAWTVSVGSQFNVSVHGPLGFAALSAPTLGEAMDVMSSLYASRSNAILAQTIATDSHYVLEMVDATGEPDFARWLAEVLMKVVETLLATILGHPVGRNVLISFKHAAPDDPAPLLAF